ncbi:YsnF/AvaK domain-containing protein [Paracoccus laeviglucosivorans]|uniref:Conserved domain-containing protein n=1 Tax=Paracoccus laeviglucosivorans TaxID=1197861 RepID=A0A521D436_9RHOB|nr:YsnF/AvaK domain-containing protein [Paracoccus laeviglucosivorans]SMO65831.1 conserved domain-containing protein [Paracoccus laeviglucosivorans]
MIRKDEMVVLFDTAAESRRAEKALEDAGFPDPEVNTLDRDAVVELVGRAEFGPTFWRTLFGREVQLYEGAVFDKALSSGGAILTVRVENDDEAARAEEILGQFTSVDLEARGAGLIAEHRALGDIKDEVLRLAEEQLEVGKRRVEAGKTRIRRYVIERPVETQVTLRQEHAEVIRKVMDQPEVLSDVDWDWNDSTIEMVETREEAVVSKRAHVAEEIVLRKGEREHVETIKDTVRKQAVEIERLDHEGNRIEDNNV